MNYDVRMLCSGLSKTREARVISPYQEQVNLFGLCKIHEREPVEAADAGMDAHVEQDFFPFEFDEVARATHLLPGPKHRHHQLIL